ncbi:hypothetical protein HYT23_04080 [Candidatus Pacearchaeota archaeon]|nr:hypothetical protein [Candidatus Pacearchaeota archaeon]
MSLDLNPAPQTFRDFNGRNVDQMPKLIAEGRTPLSVVGLMEARLKYGKQLPAWMDNYFDTGDGVLYHTDGRIKVVHDSPLIRGLNLESPLKDGALVLGDGVYDSAQGQEFERKKLEKYVESPLSKEQVKSNPIWRALARDNQGLLDEYTDFIFTQAKERFGYDKNMGVYLDSASDVPKLRAWCVVRLGDRSPARGWDDLALVNGRFVGVSTGGANEAKK